MGGVRGAVFDAMESVELRLDPAPIHDMREGGGLRSDDRHWNDILDACSSIAVICWVGASLDNVDVDMSMSWIVG